MKNLNGTELAGYIKERQFETVKRMTAQKNTPKLLIIRDSDNPVITKYVNLKCQYGEDIGVKVEDLKVENAEKAKEAILKANKDSEVSGIIVQLPIKEKDKTDEVTKLIDPAKDVDGLSGTGKFDSATATAINWLITGYDINLKDRKIALVGYGRLVGKPLCKMWKNSGYDVAVFRRNDDLSELINFDVVVSATGVPRLIKDQMIKSGAVVIDAGTASEDGVLVGDIEESIREREDLLAITPIFGGVGPLTVSTLFDNTINAAITKTNKK